jgi:glycine/D-amino acid oxidase-like deaminating enzyme
MKKISRLPRKDNTNAWSTILPHRQPHAALAAARQLAHNRPNDSSALIEAGVCGENESGRNSGFIIDLPHTTSSDLGQPGGSHRYLRLAQAATAALEKMFVTLTFNVIGHATENIIRLSRRQGRARCLILMQLS